MEYLKGRTEDGTFFCLSDLEITMPSNTIPQPDVLPMTRMHDLDDRTARKAREVLSRIGDKWTVAVIHQLGWGSRRFSQIKRGVPGISQRMLTVTLRGLERDGLATRTVHAVVPPRVDYELTEMGRTLLATVCALMAWSLEYMDAIDRAREEYDARWQEC